MKIITPIMLLLSLFGSTATLAQTSTDGSCLKQAQYRILFRDGEVGRLQRDQQWLQGMGTITSTGNIKFLVYKGSAKQQAYVRYIEHAHEVASLGFEREVDSIGRSTVVAKLDGERRQATVSEDDEVQTFTRDQAMVDFDTLAEQLRMAVANQQDQVEAHMLQADKVSHYVFRVEHQRLDRLSLPLGQVDAVKVELTNKKDRVLKMWFAPQLDYQLVKAQYKKYVIDLVGEITAFDNQCPNQPYPLQPITTPSVVASAALSNS